MFELLLVHLLLTITPVNQTCNLNASNWYSYPNFTNANFSNFVQYSNCTTGNTAFPYLMFIVFLIMVFAGKGFNIVAVVMVAAFTMSMVSGIAVILGWTQIFLPVMFIIIAVIAAAYFWFQSTN